MKPIDEAFEEWFEENKQWLLSMSRKGVAAEADRQATLRERERIVALINKWGKEDYQDDGACAEQTIIYEIADRLEGDDE